MTAPLSSRILRLGLTALIGLLCVAAVSARPYTNEDLLEMKRRYERQERQRRTVADAVFPIEIMRETFTEPPVVARMLPYPAWEEEYRRYFLRHTGERTLDLAPSIVVMHYTVCDTFAATWNTFTRGVRMSAGDKGTVFGHPSVHFVIDTDGAIYQLMPLHRRATGTYGVNHCALQIEMVAATEAQLVNNPAQLKASFRLVRALTTRFRIPRQKVYGHYQVSDGAQVVPEYLDRADAIYPRSYPPASARTDPGETYMSWLWYYLQWAPR